MGGTEMTWGSTHGPRPDGPGDEYPDYLWPDEDDEPDDARPDEAGLPTAFGAGVPPDARVPRQQGVPPAPAYAPSVGARRRTVLALAGTAALACGLGAGAMLAYRQAQSDAAPAASVSQGTGSPGTTSPGTGQGSVTELAMVGRVIAVGSGTVTIGGGPMQPVTAAVTSATRFTGAVRTLAGVRAGNTVAAQITIVNGVARLVSLQDPASES
jgi:hypothetical protein